jgi:hypothetical protein
LRGRSQGEQEQVRPIGRSTAWIVAGTLASLMFIFVLGRGLTWSR